MDMAMYQMNILLAYVVCSWFIFRLPSNKASGFFLLILGIIYTFLNTWGEKDRRIYYQNKNLHIECYSVEPHVHSARNWSKISHTWELVEMTQNERHCTAVKLSSVQRQKLWWKNLLWWLFCPLCKDILFWKIIKIIVLVFMSFWQ
jgi:hypothetical protein